MATSGECEGDSEENEEQFLFHQTQKLLSLYLGVSFSVFLAYLPESSLALLPKLQTQTRDITARLLTAEEQLRQMKSRRKEDSKANARVVEIFATHRNAWQAEEKQLLQQIQDQRAKIEELERETHESKRRIEELQDIIGFISTTSGAAGGEQQQQQEEQMEEAFAAEDTRDDQLKFNGVLNVAHNGNFPFTPDLLASASSKFWADRATVWQDIQCESLESLYHMKHFVARRESPWKVDGESTGVSSKLKLLEQELLNLEKLGKSDFSRVPSLMRKQARRYQALTAKIDDLCRRMQASDPSEPTLSVEFRTQRQTEFLLEAFRLQQHASETGQKLMALQTEIGKSYYKDDIGSSGSAKAGTKRSMDSIRNNLQEVQRNLEIWLARIIGDLEGILARDGSCSSRVREYCVSRYNSHFVQ
ncbi:Ribonuclease P protein subunit P38-related isoform 1 [Gossypium australe]|uniref:Ribonuclease P protein subunit P38-related isoform 1 n=1 Tax=Gossypium australe TaxID=47621 RepID=A0A5B6UTX5_9ROSI|nr:Ribonuclease P protein subunit P38-related isoform 1 [Gossypium australe]